MDTMKFAPGDRVKYVGTTYLTVEKGLVTVVDMDPEQRYPYRVLFDEMLIDEDFSWSGGGCGLLCSEDELELDDEI